MNKEVLIIYESTYHGNTFKIARAMADELNCELITTDQAKERDISSYKTIGFGSGIQFTRHDPKLMAYVKQLKTSQQQAFVFSTRGNPMPHKYHKEIRALLAKKGFKIIGEFSTKGYDCTGPFVLVNGGNKGKPDENDQRRAAKFVRSLDIIKPRIDLYLEKTKKSVGKEKGMHIYSINNTLLKGDLVTVNQAECIGCGTCEKKCPLGVLHLNKGKSAPYGELDCIQCNSCQHYCPARAIYIHGSWKDALRVAKRHANR